MNTTHFTVEQLVCASVLDEGEGRVSTAQELSVSAFASDGVRAARVADVLYLPDLGLQLVDRRLVPLEAIQNAWRLGFELRRNFAGKAEVYRRPFETTVVEQEVCILTNLYSRNFSIWIAEELIKVIVLERSGYRGRYVIAARLPEFAMQCMTMLGVPEERILRDVKGPTVFRSVVYVTAIQARTMARYPAPFFALREALLQAAGQAPRSSRRLWMERGVGVNNPGREVVNAEEVFALIGRYGFEIVDMAAQPLASQIALANAAEVISGPHGAAFVHAMFMPPSSTVIECFSPEFINTNWFGILQLMQHRYFMIVHKRAHDPYPFGHQIMVDCAHLELTLRTLQTRR